MSFYPYKAVAKKTPRELQPGDIITTTREVEGIVTSFMIEFISLRDDPKGNLKLNHSALARHLMKFRFIGSASGTPAEKLADWLGKGEFIQEETVYNAHLDVAIHVYEYEDDLKKEGE